MKRLLSLALVFCLLLSLVPLSVIAVEEDTTVVADAYPEFANKNYGALYAHATVGGESTQAWQRWHKDYKGINYENGVRYFFLPKTADDNKIEIYNNYSDGAVTIGDTVIESYTSAVVDYIEGEKIEATLSAGTAAEREYTFVVLKSDAEASVYVNDSTNSYVDAEGVLQETDLWSFLIQSKSNSVSDADCSIVDADGVNDVLLKKIKGRGNTNWKETDKKPFNLTFYDKTSIGGVTDKKFSFVSNAKDSTLLRNSIMYDLAYNTNSLYSPDQSFVDFFVNGEYRGSYIACRKIEMGKNYVVSLKDESEDIETDFNFLVEVDVWNYQSDVYFVSDRGYHVVLKTPDLEDFEENDPARQTRYDYIKNTYQKLEDALYEGELSDIEKVCDLNSLATQYLLQEFGKNCDGGYTSTFFTYNASEGKFYAAPIWDCDSCLGAVDCVRENCRTSTIDHTGWTTRLAKYEKTINPLGQAFYVNGKSSEGKTFEEMCKEIWKNEFLPNINILLGNSEASGRLKSIDDYQKDIENSAYINYVMWDFMWTCADKNKSLNKRYSSDYTGEVEYLKDWVKERADWISAQYELEPETTASTPVTDGKTIYFSTDLDWDNVHFYTWSTGYVPMQWPGETAQYVETKEDGSKVYKAVLNDDVANIIFNNGMDGAQTVDIAISGNNFYYTTTTTGRDNEAGYPIYNVTAGNYTEPQPETTITSTPDSEPITSVNTEVTSDPVEITSTVQVTTTDPIEVTTATTDPSEIVTTPPTTVSDPIEDTSVGITETTTSDSVTTASDSTDSSEVTTTAAETVTTSQSTIETSIPETTYTEVITTVTSPADEHDDKGDVNKDGKVNIKDVTTTQKYVARLIDLTIDALINADVNSDNRVTIADATNIQKFIAGLISWDD